MFDPTLPANGSPNSSAEMRGQFNGLKDLIDAVPGISGAVVDAVNTVNPGDPAGVAVAVSGTVLHLSFDLPRGHDGGQGAPGSQGPAFANAIVDGVNTLNPGDNASVQASFDGSSVRFVFGIPRGYDGGTGSQGQPGEVTNAQLSSAINAMSSNISNAVSTLGMTVSDPPTVGEMQAIASKLDELILALRR